MRKVIRLAAYAALAAGVMGCGESPSRTVDQIKEDMAREQRSRMRTEFGGWTAIWTDPDTGCQYVFAKSGYGGGFTHRLDRDGKPMCGDPS